MKSIIGLTMLLAASACAEITATVPFAFEAGGVKFPQGPYQIRVLSQTNPVAWVLQNVKTRQAAILLRTTTGDGQQDGKGAIRFHCAEASLCALTEFWQPGRPRNILLQPRKKSEGSQVRLVALDR